MITFSVLAAVFQMLQQKISTKLSLLKEICLTGVSYLVESFNSSGRDI